MHISPVFLGIMLRLPVGQEVVEAKINAQGNLELMVEGRGMPPRSPNENAFPATLIFHQEVRPGDVTKGGFEKRVTLNWQHDPETSWLFSNWEPFK